MIHLFLGWLVLSSCRPQLIPVPGFVETVIALTARAAKTQTAAALAKITPTPTVPTPSRTPTITDTPTPIIPLFLPTPNATLTPTLLPVPTAWPEWQTGTLVSFPKGSSLNAGKTKFFTILQGVKVRVIRKNGVKLRTHPDQAAGVPFKAAYKEILVLTGFWHKNYSFGGTYVSVIGPDGKQYWVGGTEGDDNTPEVSLEFVGRIYLTVTPQPEATFH